MSTQGGLTPEQRAAGEATLRQWRRAAQEPHQVPCHYCGTLVLLQDAEPVPDTPADADDRYACPACGAAGQGSRCTACGSVPPPSPEQVLITAGPAQGTWLVWRCAACGASRARRLQDGEREEGEQVEGEQVEGAVR